MKKILHILTILTIFTFLTILSPSIHAAEFPDVTDDAWFYPYVQEITDDGLMQGYPNGKFGSWEPVNRAELAKTIVELKRSLQESWLEKYLFEMILVVITLFGWVTTAGFMFKISEQTHKRPYKNGEHNHEIRKNSRLIAVGEHMKAHQMETHKNGKNNKKPKTNWWL